MMQEIFSNFGITASSQVLIFAYEDVGLYPRYAYTF